MASSADDAARSLGRLLTAVEARGIADRLADDDTLTVAVQVVAPDRRQEVRSALETAGLAGEPAAAIAALRAIEGARSRPTTITPVWTMPGHLAQAGALTSSVAHLVDTARTSVTCSTFNFQATSSLWAALKAAASRPYVKVRVYVDTAAAASGPSVQEVAARLHPAVVLHTTTFAGVQVRNHAKFVAVDHRFLLISSANFSWSAEHGNLEFGVLIDNSALTSRVEAELLAVENFLYERARPSTGAGA